MKKSSLVIACVAVFLLCSACAAKQNISTETDSHKETQNTTNISQSRESESSESETKESESSESETNKSQIVSKEDLNKATTKLTSMLADVLKEEAKVVLCDDELEEGNYLLSELETVFERPFHMDSIMMIDFDKDGTDEIVMHGDPILILHQEDDVVYATFNGYRNMIELYKDGSSRGSGAADNNYYTEFVSFDQGKFVNRIYLNCKGGIYYSSIDADSEIEISKEEADELLASHSNVPAVPYPYEDFIQAIQ